MTDETGTEQETAADGAQTVRKRGGQTRAAENEQDLRVAMDEIAQAHALYLAADGATYQSEREAVMREALNKVELAMRALASIKKRPSR